MLPTNTEAVVEPYRPLEQLASDPTIWLKRPGAKPMYGLGSRAMVWETTGRKDPAEQRWYFRLIKLGSVETPAKDRADAMRRAEFLLGVGEMEVREK